MRLRVGRLVILGGLVLVGVIAPALVSGPGNIDAACRAVFGNRYDGICLDGPPGPPTEAPPPGFIPGFGVDPSIGMTPQPPGTVNTPVG